ncbi:PilZ domain-containing protein [Hydrogenovibrio sp. 3SP14C1]|uniref:PilZ domain-containing protein n=1 Tax=Hydrogenovibrio sp. 3SP14C1 TaxID=3038774 RepID=UPI002415DDF8|nr:PilZ domain-containing protein [Hydrogenovibrio sp. 3SP14C1]MDG4812920.1 PilZ domain-containing protein [Hydrogenovibrio sp. 3SP14C1]
MASKNSRSFFRIDVMLPCSYHIISAEDAKNNPLPLQADSGYIEKYFMENLNELDEQIHTIISQIGQKSALLSTALTALNSKLNFLLQTVDKKQLVHAIPQQMVNISAGGVAIKVHEPVKESDKVDLLIQPLEDEPPVLVRCSIIKIIPDKDIATASTIALEYDNLSEDDRRKLVYFIQGKEIEMANQQRQ